MSELIYVFVFLLPIVWLIGYLKGRKVSKTNLNSKDQTLSKTYFTGLNYLLNEESDKAIDAFATLLSVNSETVETHLALGNLFRRRGEVDKAIQMHRNLIAKPSLTTAEKHYAVRELGYDYMAAGLLDRAENIFMELSQEKAHKFDSLNQLISIYQQTKDWTKAIKISEQFSNDQLVGQSQSISHFYCEQAERALAENDYTLANGYTEKALKFSASNVRAIMISSEIYHSKRQYANAIKCYKTIQKKDIAFLSEVIDGFVDSYTKIGDSSGLSRFFHESIENGAGVSVVLRYAEEIKKNKGDIAAAQYISDKMKEHPSIKGLLVLINMHVAHASASALASLQMLQSVVEKLLKDKPVYQCHHCGFQSKALFWQCPSCKSWGEIKPIQGIEGE